MNAHADDGNAQARFAEARAAFEAEDFPRALQLYEQCLVLGMHGPAIQYNIGVAAYRGGDLARAERAFSEVAQTTAMAALAHYNLGLVAQKRADAALARSWFERAASESTDERLTALAARQLGEPSREAPTADWSAYTRAGLGHDDNVALRSESIATPGSGEGDSFAEWVAAGSYAFRPHWRVDAAAGLTRYESLGEFDQTALSFDLTRGFEIDDWSVEVGANATRLSLGGEVYESSAAATAQATRAVALGSLHAHLRFASVNGAGDFSGISGTRAGFGLEYQRTLRSLTFAFQTRAETNDSRDDLFASRWVEAGAEARWMASPAWSFDAGLRLRHTRHPSQSTTQEAFSDRRQIFQLEATRLLRERIRLFVRYEHESAKSPVEAYEYDRNLVVVSLETWR